MMENNYKKDIDKCLITLKSGGTILYPTDTIWGLGCDATNELAVSKIYDIKQRCESKSFIILLSDVSQLENYIEEIPPIALDLIDKVNTPLTIIYQNVINTPLKLVAPDKSIAIRIVKTQFVKDLISQFDKPIVSTSANVSGRANPLVYSEIEKEIINKVNYVVEYDRFSIRQIKPSTIIEIKGDWNYKVLRS